MFYEEGNTSLQKYTQLILLSKTRKHQGIFKLSETLRSEVEMRGYGKLTGGSGSSGWQTLIVITLDLNDKQTKELLKDTPDTFH